MNTTDVKNTPLYRLLKVIYFILLVPFWGGLAFSTYISLTDRGGFIGILYAYSFAYYLVIYSLKRATKYIMLGNWKS